MLVFQLVFRDKLFTTFGVKKCNQFFVMNRFLCLLLSLLFIYTVNAQNAPQLNSSEILQGLKKLNTLGSVLYVAAHPDDENTRLLTYLSKEKNLRTGYISITRGDGGQNLIGKEQGDQLGLIRTHELLAARRTDGAEQFFTRANDFGFSKNPEETFGFWNKDSVLADVVWAIRKFKPDVIICRFPTTGEGGHGHHTASAILAVEAFDAAADPKRYPQQLTNTEVWQAKRIFFNAFNFRSTFTPTPDLLKLDVGVFNPLLGKSYGEIAGESRSMHKSQGFGSARTRGSQFEYFKQLKGDSVKTDLFEGINQSWKRFPATATFNKLIGDCIQKYDAEFPEKSVPDLVLIYKKIQQLNASDPDINYWKLQKLKETEALLLSCSGLWMEAGAADYTGIPGKTNDITVQVVNRNNSSVRLNKVSFFEQTDTITSLALKQNEVFSFKHQEQIPASLPYSNPYWLNEKHDQGTFTIKNPLLIGKPENEPAAKVVFHIVIEDLALQIEREIVYKHTDPVKGEVYRPFEILPPATVNISEKVYVFSDAQPKTIEFTVKANMKNVDGSLQVTVPDGWTLTLKNTEFKLNAKGDEAVFEAQLLPGSISTGGKLQASVRINDKTYSKSIKRIEYDHIPYQFILSDAEAGLVKMDLKKSGTTIGYIPGAGDDVAACLKQVGYNVTILTDELLTHSNISRYDAIISGIRAYNTNDRLQVHYNKLMAYVNNGGNLIVQYNTNNRIGPVVAKIGPYPFTISRDRGTDENAEVRLLKPDHPALTFPNRINSNDFNGWIQERGIYFATDLDPKYETLLSMNDPNEKPSEGSLIIAKHGKGNFVYTGLVFFRELPAGVPGAYRLLANLISLSPNK